MRIHEWILVKAKAAIAEGLPAMQADLSWKVFLAECPDLVASIAADFPPAPLEKEDTTAKVQSNFTKAKKNISECITLPGGGGSESIGVLAVTANLVSLTSCLEFPKTFADKVGHTDSNLAGCCSDQPHFPGSNKLEEEDEGKADEDFGTPFSDDNKPAATKSPPKKESPKEKTVEEQVDDLADNVNYWSVVPTNSEMKIKTCSIKDVEV